MTTIMWTILTIALYFSRSALSICLPSEPITNDYFEISCQQKHKLKFPVVKIQCQKQRMWANFPWDQKLDLPNADVTFSKCDFPQDLSLINLTKSLNLENINNLSFEKSYSPVTRSNLKGFRIKELEFTAKNGSEVPDDLLHDIIIENEFHLRFPLGWATIPKDFFKYSPNLTDVYIIEGNLTKIRRYDFNGLNKLRFMWLSHNNINEIEAGAFDDLVNLESLDIGYNELTTLPAGLFKNLINLKSFDIYNNKLTHLPANLLQIEGNNVFYDIRLNHNELESLPDGFFKDLVHLTKIKLQNNRIKNLPQNVFYNASALQDLLLQGNSLVTLPPHLFDTNTLLKNLHLSGNALETLPDKIFKTVFVRNSKIYLDYNRLTNLTQDVFFGMKNLEVLDISHNQLSSIGQICLNFTNKSNFDEHPREINLSFNNLTLKSPTELYSIFLNCLGTKKVNLSNNMINQTFFDWELLVLEKLDLDNNTFTYVDIHDLGILSSNEPYLSLRNNKITTVNVDCTEDDFTNFLQHKRKHKVDLDGNPLICDCKLISFVNYVNKKLDEKIYTFMDISYENLKCAGPPELKNKRLVDLNSKNLGCSYQTSVTDDACNGLCTCYDYPAKQTILADCSYKNLSSIPSIINTPDNYSIELNMAGNYLSEAPKLNQTESYFLKVVSLDLSNNKISKVPLETFSTSLRELNLHNNNITKFKPEVLQYLLKDRLLRNLTVSKNKWICDCEFVKIIQNKNTPLISHFIMCHNKNKLLSDLSHDDLCKNLAPIIVAVSLSVAFFGIVIGGLVALYYKYQQEIKVWLFSKQWCLWFVTEDELDKDKLYDAFISFSHKDEQFVEKEIVKKLEEGPRPYKLCLHYRDWLAGEWIPAQIARSVDESRRTIIILSPNFIESIWGRMEFRTAHSQALAEGRSRVIIVLYGDVGNFEDFDPELKAYLSMNTYVKWDDPWFWDKLRYALPHRYDPARRRTRNARIIENNLEQLSVNYNCDKAKIIPVPKDSNLSNDSTKLLDPGHQDDRNSAIC